MELSKLAFWDGGCEVGESDGMDGHKRDGRGSMGIICGKAWAGDRLEVADSCINAICVEDLGFPMDKCPSVRFEPRLKERVLQEKWFDA